MTARRPLDDAERLAEWLDSEFEPFGAHSHFGLIQGEQSYQQVAESIRGFLETAPPLRRFAVRWRTAPAATCV